MSESVEYTLNLDEGKSKDLKRGKQMYKDEDGHRWYLTADEVKSLEQPGAIRLKIDAVNGKVS